MGVHERTEEVLALADYSGISVARFSDRPDARVSRSAFYLYVVLMVCGDTVLQKRTSMVSACDTSGEDVRRLLKVNV